MTELLASLSAVRSWLAPGSGTLSTDGDPQLRSLISAASATVLNFLNRDTFGPQQVSDIYDGTRMSFILLRQWPVISVQSILLSPATAVLPATVVAGQAPTNGFILEPPPAGNGQQRLLFFGTCLPRGRAAIYATYTAGWQAVETLQVTTGTLAPAQAWVSTVSLVYASTGVPLVLVATAPTVGQYAVDEYGTFTLNAGDNGMLVTLTYGYVPADIVQATIEMIGERYRTRDRIGVSSKSLPNGETVAYMIKGMSDYTRSVLQPYMRVTPA